MLRVPMRTSTLPFPHHLFKLLTVISLVALLSDTSLGQSKPPSPPDRIEQLRDEGEYAEAYSYGKKALASLDPHSSVYAETIYQLGCTYVDDSNYEQAIKLLKSAFALYVALKDQEGIALTEVCFASAYQGLEQYSKAERYSRSAISLYESLGPNGPGMSAALVNKANIDLDQSLFVDAQVELNRALNIDKAVWGEKDPEFAKTLYFMAKLYQKTGHFSEARNTLNQVYEIDKAAFHGEDNFQVNGDIYAIADLCLAVADFACASENAIKGLNIDKKLFGDNDGSVASDYEQMASRSSAKGDYSEAQRLYRDAIQVLSKHYKYDSDLVSWAYSELAQLLSTAGQYSDSLKEWKRVRAIDIAFYGAEHKEVAADDFSIGTQYRNLGDYVSAIYWIRQAISIDTHFYGLESYNVAADELRLATVYNFREDNGKALKLALHATSTILKTEGDNSLKYADALILTGSYFFRPQDYQRAITMGEQSLKIYERVYGLDSPSTFSRMNELARIYTQAFQFDKAEQTVRAALNGHLRLWKGQSHPDVAADYERLAQISRARQNLPDAIAHFETALDIRKKFFGEKNWAVSFTLYFIAQLHYEAGHYGEAIKILDSAIDIEEGYGKRPFLGSLYNTLGSVYFTRNDLVSSEASYRKALELFSKSLSVNNATSVPTLCNLGLIKRVLHQDQKALPLYTQALVVAKTISPGSLLTVTPMLGLATMRLDRGDFSGAIELLLEVRRLFETKEKTIEYAYAVGFLGSLYQREKHYAEAEQYYKEALEVRLQIVGPQHPAVATSYSNFASLYAERGQYSEAVGYERKNIEILEHTIDSLVSMGSEEAKLKYVSLLARQTWGTVSRYIGVSGSDATEIIAETILRRKARALDATAEVIENLPGQTKEVVDLIDELRNKKTELAFLLFNDSAQEGPVVVKERVTSSSKTKTDNVEHRHEPALALERGPAGDSARILLNPRATGSPSYRAKIEETVKRIQVIESELSEKRGMPLRETATVASLRAALPSNSVLIEYYVYRPYRPYSLGGQDYGRERLVAYVVTPERGPRVRDLGWLDDATKEIMNFRKAIAAHSSNEVQTGGQCLFERLLGPFADDLEHRDRLFISPDGSLGVLPFSALRMPNGEYLLQRLAVSYVTAARDIMSESKPDASLSTLTGPVIVANPAFSSFIASTASVAPNDQVSGERSDDALPTPYFEPLALTAEEGRAICDFLRCGDNFLVENRATKDSILQLHSPVVLHIATHGFFLKPRHDSLLFAIEADGAVTSLYGTPQDNPMLDSGLALAGVNVPGQRARGILTALELSTVDLSSTQLVVLSACETGFGTDFTGEGVLGLRRAIRLAGASRQVTSLWKVNNRVTADLMVRFYQHFVDSTSHIDALHQAQLEIFGKAATADPYYWAAFVSDGTWKNVSAGVLLKAGKSATTQ